MPPSTAALSLSIADSPDEQWAVVSPAASVGRGSMLNAALLSVLAGTSRPQQVRAGTSNDTLPIHPMHPRTHPFAGRSAGLVGLATFARQNHQQGGGASEFQDFSARYGALREEDLVTLFERLMDIQGFDVGRVATLRILPDKLNDTAQVESQVRAHARATKERIERLAPLLGLHKPGPGSPGGVALLHQPVISLSNGQLRRARILNALVQLEETAASAASEAPIGPLRSANDRPTSLLVLDQPYSGLDEPSRAELAQLLSLLHKKGTPRVIQVLRRQDEIPEGVTHIIDIDTQGHVWMGSRHAWAGNDVVKPAGAEGIRTNHENGIGIGCGPDLAALHSVSVQYGDKVVLDSVDLTLREGSRLIVKGANGSGKTTLLSLLSGTHPQSFSLPDESYTLFGQRRAAPGNASRLLARKIGYFGPDLLAAFPRRGVESGGLTVGDAIASGFEGVFSRVNVSEGQADRVRALLGVFMDCIAFRERSRGTQSDAGEQLSVSASAFVDSIVRRPFIELTNGSQALVLFLRAIASQPSILILDEPFQGMDAVQIARIHAYIDSEADTALAGDPGDMERRRKSAIVLVSHYVHEWPRSMGEFLHLRDGKVIERI